MLSSHLLGASCLFGWMVEWCCAGEVPFEAQLGSEFSAPGTFVVGLGIPLFETWEARLCHRSAFQVGIPAIFAPMKFRWNTRSMILAKAQRLKRTPLGFFEETIFQCLLKILIRKNWSLTQPSFSPFTFLEPNLDFNPNFGALEKPWCEKNTNRNAGVLHAKELSK